MKTLSVILLTIACSYANAGVIAHWTFDETSGTTAHDTVSNYDGTLIGGTSFVSGGISSNALSLDTTTGSLVNLGASFPGFTTGDFSVVAWVKTTTTAAGAVILSKHEAGPANGYILSINPSPPYGQAGQAYFYASARGGEEVISTTTVNDGNWHQIIGVYTAGGTTQIYVDGAPAENTEASQPMVGNLAPFLLGGHNSGGTPLAGFTGLLDDVQVYSSALSDSDVQFLFEHPGQVVLDLPILTIEVSEVRLCWNSTSNTMYQVQYRSDLTANEWANLGTPIVGNGTTNCITDAVVGPRRFYPVLVLP